VEIVADTVQFLGSRDGSAQGGGGNGGGFTPQSDVPAETGDFTPAGGDTGSGGGGGAPDDDIPF